MGGATELVSFSRRLLAQHEVSDGGDEREGEGDPRQDVGVAVPAEVLVPVEAIRVDGGCDHDAQACWKRRGRGGGGDADADADVSEGPGRRLGCGVLENRQ